MPIYFIDTDDGERCVEDEGGQELADDACARRLALEALLDLAADTMIQNDTRTLSASVRDAGGTIIYEAEITLRGVWRKSRRTLMGASR